MYKFLGHPNGITHLDLSGTECALENVSLETNSICREIFYFIGKSDIFSLICAADKVWITELTLIHKNISSVRDSHVQVYQSILFIHIMMSRIKTIASVLKALTDIITNITARSYQTH